MATRRLYDGLIQSLPNYNEAIPHDYFPSIKFFRGKFAKFYVFNFSNLVLPVFNKHAVHAEEYVLLQVVLS